MNHLTKLNLIAQVLRNNLNVSNVHRWERWATVSHKPVKKFQAIGSVSMMFNYIAWLYSYQVKEKVIRTSYNQTWKVFQHYRWYHRSMFCLNQTDVHVMSLLFVSNLLDCRFEKKIQKPFLIIWHLKNIEMEEILHSNSL